MLAPLTREDYLMITGLDRYETFELSPCRRPDDGRMCIKVSAPNRQGVLHDPTTFTSHLEDLRKVDPDLAGKIDTCLEELERYAERSD